jgi:hypothetical protein
MPTQVQFRRGTTAQNQNFTGAAGEISIDTSKKTVIVHDGSTPGGFPLAPNTAFDVANAAFNAQNADFTLSNASYDVANAAFGKANSANVLAYNTGIGANAYADMLHSNNYYAIQVGNSANNYAGAMANSANDYSYAFAQNISSVLHSNMANNAVAANNYAGAMANSGNVFTGTVYTAVNSAFGVINAAYTSSNADYVVSNAAFTVANAAFGIANNAYTATNGAASFALTNTTYAAVNSAFAVINAAFGQANTLKTSANAYADLVGTSANNYAGRMANSANSYAASLTPDLSPAFSKANTAYTVANGAFDKANAVATGANAYATAVGTAGNTYAATVGTNANNYSNSTFVKLTAGSQTITGDFSISGNLFIGGNTTAVSANNLIVNDSLIYLANNNLSDTLDIGFVGSYTNGTSASVHTGLYREHASKQYSLFQGFDADPELINEIVQYANNMVNATLIADFKTSNLTLGSANAITWITSGFGVANAAYGQANTLATSANAYAAAVGVSANAYAVTVGTSGNAFATAIGTAGNAYAQTVGTSGNNYAATVGTSSNSYAGVMANSVNAYTTATYSTLTQFGSVFGVANGAFGAANGKVASVTGTAGQIYSSGGTAPTLNLISSGVTAATYGGGGTQVPVLTVDAFGRVTSASNTTVNGMDYAYANTIWGVANAAFARGNTSAQLAFFRVAANGSNLDAASNADTLTIRSSNNIVLIANSTNDSLQITQSPSGVTATTYGGSTNIPVIVVDAFGRITSASNTTVNGMDYAYANTIWGVANAGFTVANAAFAKANAAATAASPTITGTINMQAAIANYSLTDGANIDWNLNTGQVATVTLGGNRTMNAPTNLRVGTFILHVIQDATGSRTITWNSVFKWPAAVAPTLTTTGSRRDIISFVCDGTNLYGSFLPDVR